MDDYFQLLGVIGLLFVAAGVVARTRRRKDVLFISGGLLLTSYSSYKGDAVFIALQIIFTLAAFYDFVLLKLTRHAK